MDSKMENSRRRLLVVDDDPEVVKITKKALEWDGYQVEVAKSGNEAIACMEKWQPNLVLLDVNMPELNGIETLQFLRQQEQWVSVIFVSAKTETEDIIRGLDSGADDYICKPFHAQELLARVRCQLRIKDIRDELTQANARLQELVEIDDLTGLYNMRSIYKRLDHELQRAARYNRSVCAIMMDMDNFKTVNDQQDHLFGSFVLKEVGQIIKANVRKVDFAARYGGDEFLVVLTEIDLSGAQAFTERLRQAIETHEFRNAEFGKKLTSSLGFAITAPGSKSIDARTLVRYADRALYDAKEAGRNQVKFYDFSAIDRLNDESELPDPLKRHKAS